ncbi:MAG TPA: hypothetical protein P5567_12750 [Kiritimatiellia bacterium]|nr:hypothetical protein [Kiritimatiellia bacterium]HRZ13310.1 hypothetical protein [Kiritimatiellia bacterium]HSA18759.1 hypothetical protein [Kiritimatiellia bacterium]
MRPKILYQSLILLCLAAALLEMSLTLVSPERRGEWNGRFDDQIYTWGHPVRPNLQGLREREIAVPKPAGVFRVLVLGDESTWGPGLAEDERFTALAESRLRQQDPDRRIEVLNAGLPEATLPVLRDALLFWCEAPVEPDLVVVAFGGGALRLDSNENRPEHVAFARRHPAIGLAAPRALTALRMPQTARLWRRTAARLAEATGAAPSYEEFLAHRYGPDSPAWPEFAGALRDIREFCRARNLPPPVFLSLHVGHPAADWYARAAKQAEESGFVAPSCVADIAPKVDARDINLLNGIHPRHFQAAWAESLSRSVAAALDRQHEVLP